MRPEYCFYMVNETPEALAAVRELVCADDLYARMGHAQFNQSIYLLEDEPHETRTYLSFERLEDVEAMTDLLAGLGIFLAPYSPYVGEGWV